MTFRIGRLHGRHALVTGGSRGIGAATAEALVAAGARVTILGRSPDAIAMEVARLRQHGGQAAGEVADVTDEAAVRRAFAAAAEHFGPVEVLVANAGGARSAPYAKTDTALLDEMLHLNLHSAHHCIQAALPGMRAAGFGRIVCVASTAALEGYAYVSAYCTAKHALLGLVRSVAAELAGSGVTVNAVCPGYVDTEMTAASIAAIGAVTGRTEAQARTDLARMNPQGRLLRPGEVATAILHLITGEDSGRAVTIEDEDAGVLPVRLWLRLLATAGLIETRLRRRLQRRFSTTMPRFDAMAQLHRAPEGMTLSRLSDRMMVTKGNITGLVDRLVEDGFIERLPVPGDRRASTVRLTDNGRERFAEMAPRMQGWIRELLSGLPPADQERLHGLVGSLKTSVRSASEDEPQPQTPADRRETASQGGAP